LTAASIIPPLPSDTRSTREARGYEERPRLVGVMQLVLLVASVCLLFSLMVGALFVSLIVQVGLFGH
jgi:hypothetical protein